MASGKRVLVTRAPHQGSALADKLEALGLQPVLLPTIEIAEPSSYAVMDTALAHLERFDWLLFTSANAVSVFADRRPHPLPAHIRLAAIGQATAQALHAAGLPVSLVPASAVAESLAASLLPFAAQPGGQPTRFLLLRAEQGRDELPDALQAAGAEVTLAPAYRTVIPAESAARLRDLLRKEEAGLAAITFTSSSSARNWLALCEAAEISLPDDVLRVSIGPVTSKTLDELGIPAHAEARDATVAALAQAVAEALQNDRHRKSSGL